VPLSSPAHPPDSRRRLYRAGLRWYIGIILYVALVIAIPVCRMLDWFSGETPDGRKPSRNNLNTVRSRFGRLTGRGRPGRPPNAKHS
jgi:hypothetical protein